MIFFKEISDLKLKNMSTLICKKKIHTSIYP